MKDAIKVNRKGPRFKAHRFNSLSPEILQKIAKRHDCLVKDTGKIKQIIVAANKAIANTVIDFRDGIELPDQLGHLFLGNFQRTNCSLRRPFARQSCNCA